MTPPPPHAIPMTWFCAHCRQAVVVPPVRDCPQCGHQAFLTTAPTTNIPATVSADPGAVHALTPETCPKCRRTHNDGPDPCGDPFHELSVREREFMKVITALFDDEPYQGPNEPHWPHHVYCNYQSRRLGDQFCNCKLGQRLFNLKRDKQQVEAERDRIKSELAYAISCLTPEQLANYERGGAALVRLDAKPAPPAA